MDAGIFVKLFTLFSSDHMSSVCGEFLRKKEGHNYRVINDDALKVMEEFKVGGKCSKAEFANFFRTRPFSTETRPIL